MTFKTFAAAAALALFAQGATAEEIALEAPMAGASLHTGGIDMVVYYMDRSDHFEVVATYALSDAPSEPARLRMGLADGDSARFGLPGEPHVRYEFSRSGATVRVEATELSDDFAHLTE